MDTSQYKELFISESQEILARLNKSLVELEKRPEDSELLNEIFRLAHTLKGMSASMGYEEIVKLSHSMESVLDLLRNHRLKAEKETVSLLFEALDLLEEMLEESATTEARKGTTEARKKKVDIACVVDKLGEITCSIPILKEGHPKEERRMLRLEQEDRIAIAKAASEGILTYRVTVTLAKGCKMKEVRATLILKELSQMGSISKEHYIINQIKSGRFGRYFGCFFMTKENPKLVKEKIEAIYEVEKIDLKPLEVDEVLLPKTEDRRPEVKKLPEVQTVRVAVERLDNLMNLTGELVINRIRLQNIGTPLENKPLTEALTQLNRLTSDIQNEMMTVRLVPMAYIFDRFPRMVRDLSKEEDKDIELEISGSDIGLDRAILDEINDPLIHLLRNAVNHGIEEPKVRQKNGKPKTGHIRLSVQKERNFVIIEASDDGAGMDVNEVKQVAVKKKLISEEEVSKLSDEDAMMLITQPGFSTSKKVTETSGRGVGMNTVRSKVESFGGSLTIETKLNKGSKFTLKLPVSMAILQALLVKVATEIYAIPLTNISETIKIDTGIIKMMEHHEVIPYRDEVLPLVRLREKFGFATADGADKSAKSAEAEDLSAKSAVGGCPTIVFSPLDRRDFPVPPRREAIAGGVRKPRLSELSDSPVARIPVVVVEIGRKKVGFVVDELVGQQEVVIKSLTGDLKGMPGVAGATIMGDGRVAMIVDAPSII